MEYGTTCDVQTFDLARIPANGCICMHVATHVQECLVMSVTRLFTCIRMLRVCTCNYVRACYVMSCNQMHRVYVEGMLRVYARVICPVPMIVSLFQFVRVKCVSCGMISIVCMLCVNYMVYLMCIF